MKESDELSRIIQGCKNNDAESFSRLVDMYAGRLYGFFYRLTGKREVSNDLLGEVFVRLVEKIRAFKKGSFDAWLFRTASNIFNDYLRRKYREQRILQRHKEQFEADLAGSGGSDAEMVDKLQIQLSRLDTDTRKLIMLRFYSGLSFKEIAQMRSEPIGTTLSKVHRGLKKLREFME